MQERFIATFEEIGEKPNFIQSIGKSRWIFGSGIHITTLSSNRVLSIPFVPYEF